MKKEIALNEFIDHTNVRPIASEKDIKKLCQEAKKYKFHSVCVSPYYVSLAKKELKGSKIKICAVIGFPWGYTTTKTKVSEAIEAVKNGADEIDMVINNCALKSSEYQYVQKDIREVVKAVDPHLVKVILETGFLSKREIVKACQLAKGAGAIFVKTSTGYGPRGAKVSDIKLMRQTVSKTMKIKASGGIRTKEDALKMIRASADRIGTSNGVEIVQGTAGKKSY